MKGVPKYPIKTTKNRNSYTQHIYISLIYCHFHRIIRGLIARFLLIKKNNLSLDSSIYIYIYNEKYSG